MYIVPKLRLIKSFIDLVYVLDEDSRRGLSNQILAAQEKVASWSWSTVLQWPALAFLGRELNEAVGRTSRFNWAVEEWEHGDAMY